MIVNMSTWASLEALADFVYGEEHRAIMVQRRQWFEKFESVYLALWSMHPGHVPSIDEAKERLALLEANGPTPEAFTFRRPFPAPDEIVGVEADDDWRCSV